MDPVLSFQLFVWLVVLLTWLALIGLYEDHHRRGAGQPRSGWRLGFIFPQLGDVDLEQSGSKVYANHGAICGSFSHILPFEPSGFIFDLSSPHRTLYRQLRLALR